MTNNRTARYEQALANIPAPGCGNNCHTYLLSVSNLGARAGLCPERIFEDLRGNIPRGQRRVSDKEIWDAIRRAFSDHSAGQPVCTRKPRPLVNDGRAVLGKLIEQGRDATEESIRCASPIPIDGEDDAVLVLQTLYAGDDLLFIGERVEAGIIGKTIRKPGEWVQYFRRGGRPGPHLLVNPLTGKPAPKKSGEGMTYRGDGNVAAYRFCVVEFDNLTRDEQLAFWSVANLPICALIDSGGKSVHGWLGVPKLAGVQSAEEWNYSIREQLYHQLLIPLGVDGACSNPARLSRLPGHFRAEKGHWQRLLYLAPDGRRVFS